MMESIMDIDMATLYDLNILSRHDQQSVLNLLNYTRTSGGKEYLVQLFYHPFNKTQQIIHTQEILKAFIFRMEQFSETISNGTIMVLDKYFESPIGSIPHPAGSFNSMMYKWFSRIDFNSVKYSVKHILDFVYGMREMLNLFENEPLAPPLKKVIDKIHQQLDIPDLKMMAGIKKGELLSAKQIIEIGWLTYLHKLSFQTLEEQFFKIDSWYGLARACVEHNLQFPEIIETSSPLIEVEGLYHPLVEMPVSYRFSLNKERNFLFLTGANMAGKSTFIRSVGLAVYLGSLGMGVPAEKMQMSCFDGILSNIEVSDNTLSGESYFFNEVKRIKTTVSKVKDGKKWLILIDELFKGTNIVDAMKCSTSVIEGLRKVDTSLFILSTHLYEIAENLKQYENVVFKYFETQSVGDNLLFSYNLKDGVSNDRLGYLILKREKVVEMLDLLGTEPKIEK